MEYMFQVVETSQKTTLLGQKWWDWDWDNGGTVLETENLNQGPRLPVLAFAGYGTVNRTPLPQPLKRTSPINRTHNKTQKNNETRELEKLCDVYVPFTGPQNLSDMC